MPTASTSPFFHRLTGEARDRRASTSLRLLAVIDTGAGVARYAPTPARRPTHVRLVLTRLSRTSPRHAVRKAG